LALAGVAIGMGLLAVAAWAYRPAYYLSRLEADPQGSMAEALQRMGPRVLARIYPLLATCDDEALRLSLVELIQAIRNDAVAETSGTTDVTENRVAAMAIDRAMVDALTGAYLDGSSGAERVRIAGVMMRLDFRMELGVFCEISRESEAPPEWTFGIGTYATFLSARQAPEGPGYPWHGASTEEIAGRQGEIRDALAACPIPNLIAVLQSAVADVTPLGGPSTALGSTTHALGRLRPFDDRIEAALTRAAPHVTTAVGVAQALDALTMDAEGNLGTMDEQVAATANEVFQRAESPQPRAGVIAWLGNRTSSEEVATRTLCRLFRRATANERSLILSELQRTSRGTRTACVEPLLTALEDSTGAVSVGDWPRHLAAWFARFPDPSNVERLRAVASSGHASEVGSLVGEGLATWVE